MYTKIIVYTMDSFMKDYRKLPAQAETENFVYQKRMFH
jgi:hypothetical protein